MYKATQNSYSSRAAAARIILAMLEQGQSFTTLLPKYQSLVANTDMGLLQELCFGVARVLPRLDAIIQKLAKKPFNKKNKIVYCLLLVGLYQIIYTRIPEHAAVDEVVRATKTLKIEEFKAVINAILRNFIRQQDEILAEIDQEFQTLHPEWLTNKLKYAYPDNWQEIIQANNQRPPMWLRVNLQQFSAIEYLELLKQQDIEAQLGDLPQSILLLSPVPVHKLPYFAQGAVFVQDLHAQYSALLLEPQNNELILDACAAPGGKTTHILELAPKAQVIALDVEQNRLTRISENLERLHQQAQIICGDARFPDEYLATDMLFDRILVDAPCSATGVIRRHPDIKWLRKEKDIQPLQKLQQQILFALWAKLKVNGVLLYTTCSVLPDENSRQIRDFLAKQPNAELLPLNIPSPIKSTYGSQLLPAENSGDGFYFAKLIKTA